MTRNEGTIIRKASAGLLGLALAAGLSAAAQEPPAAGLPDTTQAADPEVAQKMAQGVMESMSGEHAHHHAHMKFTSPRPLTPEDAKRADEILSVLRQSIEKYRDYHAALAENYRIFLPHLSQAMYHFTNYRYGYEAETKFVPARPTSLLYKKTDAGYTLIGAMYTASRFTSEDELNARVPLSVARWHAHINICLPPRGQGPRADLTKFGPNGSIATQEQCDAAGGRFLGQIFGWMVHVYPFEKSPESIWGH